MKSRHMPIHTV